MSWTQSKSRPQDAGGADANFRFSIVMVNAVAMHGFRVPLNGDVQIPEELVVVPPESV